MSQATAAEPATSQGPLELSRVQICRSWRWWCRTRWPTPTWARPRRGDVLPHPGRILRGLDHGQRREVEEALGRITLRLVREADAEARRTGVPRGRRAVQAGGGTTW